MIIMNMNNLCLGKIIRFSMGQCGILVIFISCFMQNLVCCASNVAAVSNASSVLSQGQVLRDGQTLISEGGSFKFGFFSPPRSLVRYVGIWYANIPVDSVVWVANRDAPILSKNGSVSFGNDGNLVVLDEFGKTVWSSVITSMVNSSGYTAVLLDNGNLIIRGSNEYPQPNITCWQSFHLPTDTYLPGMRVPVNQKLGEIRILTSNKSDSDPGTGNYSMGLDPRASPQFVIWEGATRIWRSGHWNGIKFLGVPQIASFYNYGFKLSNHDSNGNMYFTYSPENESVTFRFRMTWDGFEKALIWPPNATDWTVFQAQPSSDCDQYNKCGVYGYCSVAMYPMCNCFQGFEPRYTDEWREGNWSGGCVRKTLLHCERNGSQFGDQDGFVVVNNAKLPDFADLLLNTDEDGCRDWCLSNCSCVAYSYVSTIGCMTWATDLLDVQTFTVGSTKLFVRVASTDMGNRSKLSGPKIVAIVLCGVIILCILLILCLGRYGSKMKALQTNYEWSEALKIRLRKTPGCSTEMSRSQDIIGAGNLTNSPDLSLFNYDTVASATNFFSDKQKLGEGGFGPVYRGMLPGRQEVAVKKLSRKSGQGMQEFKNEIVLIAKLQHRNLVRILGFCMHGEEKMLLYEYMPNKSLDCFIFDPAKKGQLDWRKRFTIIEGIARGLLYLHRDARCRIIHRDLKASNILLDQEMNPKISDFGMARIFGGDQDEASTNRVVGTYGYMSPEYAMEGFFSEKSDVYSFGVLLLEVITGQRNARFQFREHMNLTEYSWELWNGGRSMELVDSSIGSSCPGNEVSRSAHIAMLCVQDSAVYRPTMSQVVLWLESDSIALPDPKKPTLTSSMRRFIDKNYRKAANDIDTSNDLTITNLIGR